MESLAFDTSVIALTVLHGAKHGLNPSEVEAATRALNIYSIARNDRFCVGLERLASDTVNGLAFTFLCTPPEDQNLMISLLDTLRLIEHLFKKWLTRNRLHRLLKRRSDKRKVAEYRALLRKRLSMFGLLDGMSIRDNFDRVRTVQEQPQHSDSVTQDGQFRQEGEALSITGDSGPDHAATNVHIPSSDPLLSQRARITESALPRRTTQRADSHTPIAAGSSPSPLDPPPLPQIPFTTFLGSQVTIFVIDQLIAHFPSITENHDSGNVTNTTVTGSANDSSFRSA